jgi:hypothetical protein
MADTSKNINIDDKELDRDIRNLHLKPLDMVPPSTVDECEFYDDDMKDWLKGEAEKANS